MKNEVNGKGDRIAKAFFGKEKRIMKENSDCRLIPAEKTKLAECEKVIERGRIIFQEVGSALLEIRDSRLYRESHKTFEDYCQEKWSMSKTHALEGLPVPIPTFEPGYRIHHSVICSASVVASRQPLPPSFFDIAGSLPDIALAWSSGPLRRSSSSP